MKFPLDVDSAVKNSGKATVAQKMTLLVTVLVLVSVYVFFLISSKLKAIGIPVAFGLMAQILVTLIIAITLVRHFVLRENDKVKEYEGSKDVSLSNYYYLESKERLEEIEKVPLFEFSDNNFMIAIQFSYGSFTRKQADNTRELFQSLLRQSFYKGLEVRTINMPEKFEDTKECNIFLSNLSRISNDRVSTIMREISSGLLEECSNYNSLMCTTLLIKTTDPIQIENYKSLINFIIKEYQSREHSIRSMNFMNQEDVKRFMRDYYGLEALDLSSLKTAKVSQGLLSEFRSVVRVCELELYNGETKQIEETTQKTKSKRIF